MNRSTSISTLAYGGSLAGLAVAVLLRWLLDPVLGDTLQLITLFAAIGLAVWIGGYRPALLVVVLGYMACAYLFIQPRGQFGLSEPRNFVGLLLYLATASIIIGFGEAFRRAQQHSRLGEESAQRQAELMRITLASIGDAVIATDPAGCVTNMNAVAQALTGWSNDEAAGLPLTQVFRIVNESTRLEVENPALRALKDGLIVGLANHTLLIAKDGTERPIDDSAAPIRRHDGEIVGCVLVFRDISERYRAEAEQRQARQQVVTTLESVTDGFIRYDRDWQIVYVNAEAERINRLARSELLGRNLWELFPALVGTHFEAEFRRAVAEQTTVEFENHYEPFGRWSSVKGYPTPDGGLTTFVRDISAQKESENALRASEERSEFVRRSSGVGFWYCDLPFDVLQWDELVKAHFHLPPDASVTIQTFYDRIHPEDREPTRQAIERSIADRTHYDTIYRTVNPDTGAVTWVQAIGRTFYAADGTPSRFDGVTLDVSDRKRAEQEIIRIAAESERQRRLYETVLTNTPDFVYVFSLDHKVLYANEALIKMWGRGHEGAIGKTFLEIGYEPWHAEMHDREIDQVRATRQPIRGEVPFHGTHGRREYDYIFVPVIGADGEVEAVAGTTRDVTERKQTENQLRRNHDTFFALIQNNPFGVYAVDADFRLRQVSLGAQKVFETVRPLLGRDFSEVLRALWPEPFVSEALARFRHTLATGEPYSAPSTIQRRADIGVVESYDWRIERITLPDGRYGVVCYFYDLSERQQWEATLLDSEERLRLATNAAELGIWTWQPDADVVAWENDRPYEIFALSRTEPPLTAARFKADFLHPRDIETFEREFGRAVRTKSPLLCECRIRRTDGQTRWVAFTGRPVEGEENLRLIGTVQDITDRKLIEEERERLLGQLRDQDKRKDEFLATLAHELRNPLAPIHNSLQVLRLAGVNGTIEQARAMMERQLAQLVRLVDDLLDVSRVTSGKLALRRERIELKTVIDAAVETSRPAIELAGHELTVAVPDEPILLDGDATRLAQVVSNLLNNSAKYTLRGGHIRLTVRREKGLAVVVVADDGIGIPPHMVGRVFEMFTQVDRALEKTTGGLGIGLSLVKGLVEMHGGTIEARSEGEGRGSEFIARLPVAVSIAQKVEPSGVDEPVGSFRRRRILVADDNIDSARSLGRLLELHGNDVRTAHDGLQAVDAAEAFQPEVILLDIAMPKLNGYEVCRRIREQPWGQNAILVAMTGWGQEEDKRRSHEAGFDLHLVKPVDFGAIKKLLSSLKTEMD